MDGQVIQYLADGTWADIDGNPIPAPKPGLMLPVVMTSGQIDLSGLTEISSIQRSGEICIAASPVAYVNTNARQWTPNDAGSHSGGHIPTPAIQAFVDGKWVPLNNAQ